jgi:cyclophilin family peptidyl-prolyl cis-trans isomerase
MKTHPLQALWGALAAALTLSLSACGGGGGDSGGPPPVVTSSGVTPGVKYSDSMLVTLNGTNLDAPMTLTSAGCKNFTRGTSAPNVSTATTAYYTCTVSGVGSQVVTVTAYSATVTTVPFSINEPEVTFNVSNGAGVSGSFTLQLKPAQAPVTVDNFLNYVKTGWYNGVIFHRNSPGFVLQGGGYNAGLAPGLSYPAVKPPNANITLEDNTGLSNVQWAVAMARDLLPDTANSQFFINLVNNGSSLDRLGNARGYAVFATVNSGTAFVNQMLAAPCVAAPGLVFTGECLPVPNLAITGAAQTR